ncbi:LysM peptidoglycan-binding domain-containing protein [Robiginitalea sp. M366]|uniref:lytic transglycosylase domain-containing protein n=1 Tax=Robiginitalea aestuariiviva TaxID=3036903 RepID=UPI00240DF7D6|nr:lytic transglycosylase domain-containing protein [Robiginitalea aestuariiviva]MDG1571494.1 LysM peptidoglycan-binding domain-containing protein [Robiginitalea aestuariiviva]
MKKHLALCALLSFAGTLAQSEPAAPAKASDSASILKPSGPPDLQEVRLARSGNDALADLEQAAALDSLWLQELSRAGDWFVELQEALAETDTALSENEKAVSTEVLKERLARLDEQTPFHIGYNPSLERVINAFLTGKRDLMERMLGASQFYFPMFEEALDKHDLPLEIKHLAIVESALNPRAKSRVGATGLWQFMFGTGKMYDLEVSSYVDERSDPLLATEAACRYLSKLYEIFGDWDLALAAYNSGPGNVNKAIRRSGGRTNYWNIRPFLPRETAGYVPAFYATLYIFAYAKEHGLNYRQAHRPYFETDTVWVKNTLTFAQISKYTGLPEAEIQLLNPAYKLDIIPKVAGKPYTLRLPVRALGRFVAHEDSIYTWASRELESREKPLPQLVQAQDRIRYRVRSGDYLGKIAERYGVGVSQIKRWNGLRSDNLRVGQRLTIYPRRPVASVQPSSKPAPQTASASGSQPKVHVVRPGDSLWTISRLYPGISIENLREWNGISGNNLQPGTRLKLCNCSS